MLRLWPNVVRKRRSSAPPRSTAVLREAAKTAPTQRDRHLRHIAEHGRMGWLKASGYTARAEAAINRFKQVIGGRLGSCADDRRATGMEVAVHALNRMTELGSVNYLRTARPQTGLGLLRPLSRSVQHPGAGRTKPAPGATR